MRFYEFESKQLLTKHAIPVCKGTVASSPAEAEKAAADIGCPVVVKAQVLSGGRQKAGGVKFADTEAEAKAAAEEIFATKFSGLDAVSVLVEKKADVTKEFCISITYDAVAKLPVMIMSDMGGNDIDDLTDDHPDHVVRRHFSTMHPMRASTYKAKELVSAMGFKGSELNRMTAIVSRLASLFLDYDLTIAEINSLGQTSDGKFVALDCRMDMEEEGRERQTGVLDMFGIVPEETRGVRGEPTEFEREAAKIDAEDPRGIISPICDFDGDMGLVIGAGGGSLTIFDAVKAHGGNPANYAAVGGNPSVGKVRKFTKLLLGKPKVKKIAVMSNVVSNTRADLVARGVISGILELGLDPKEVITIFRVPGAWEADAFKILEKYGIDYCDRTVSLSEAARRAVAKLHQSES